MDSLVLICLLWTAPPAVYAQGAARNFLPKVAPNLTVTLPPSVNPHVTAPFPANLPVTIRAIRPPKLPGRSAGFLRYECPAGQHFLGWASECAYLCSHTPSANTWIYYFQPPMSVAAENKPCVVRINGVMQRGVCQWDRFGISCL